VAKFGNGAETCGRILALIFSMIRNISGYLHLRSWYEKR